MCVMCTVFDIRTVCNVYYSQSVSGGAHLGGNREGSALHIGSLQAAPSMYTLIVITFYLYHTVIK